MRHTSGRWFEPSTGISATLSIHAFSDRNPTSDRSRQRAEKRDKMQMEAASSGSCVSAAAAFESGQPRHFCTQRNFCDETTASFSSKQQAAAGIRSTARKMTHVRVACSCSPGSFNVSPRLKTVKMRLFQCLDRQQTNCCDSFKVSPRVTCGKNVARSTPRRESKDSNTRRGIRPYA